MKISIKDIKGKSQGELEVKFELVEDGKGTQAVHDTVVAYRRPSAWALPAPRTSPVTFPVRTKSRGRANGRARAGSFQSPLWVMVAWSSDPSPAISQKGQQQD